MICLAFPWYPLGNHSLYSSSLNYNTAEYSLLICVQCILKFRNMPQPGISAPQQEYRSIAGFQLIQFLRALVQMGQYLCPDIFFLQEFLKDLRIEKTTYKLLNQGDIEITDVVSQYDYGYFSSIYGYFLFKDSVKVSTDLDTTVPGIYSVEYTVRHPTERTRGSANLIVVVEP